MSGHRKPSYARHRTDDGSKALATYAASLGVTVVNLGGSIDAAFVWGDSVRLVDFKGEKGELTSEQSKLVARGVPIAFVSSAEHVLALVKSMKERRA